MFYKRIQLILLSTGLLPKLLPKVLHKLLFKLEAESGYVYKLIKSLDKLINKCARLNSKKI